MKNYKITYYADTVGSTDIGNSVTYTNVHGDYWYYPADFPIDSPCWNKHEQPIYQNINPFNTNNEDITKIKEDLNKLKEKFKQGKIPMKNLYNVVVVSIDEEILLDAKVVAVDRDEASFNAGVHKKIEEKGLKPKDVSILVRDLGQVKVRPEKKRVIVEKE
jgi:hypothetical protein